MVDVAGRLTRLRQDFGYSKEDLADILQVEDGLVYAWERGEAFPSESELQRLASLYRVPVEYIVTDELPEEHVRQAGWLEGIFGKQAGASLPIIVLLAFFGMGFALNLWRISWLLLLLIPLYYTTVGGRKKGEGLVNDANFPLIVVTLYLTAGMLFGRWHPSWIIFLTIPLYYTIGRNK